MTKEDIRTIASITSVMLTIIVLLKQFGVL